jgi:hypothetical protein
LSLFNHKRLLFLNESTIWILIFILKFIRRIIIEIFFIFLINIRNLLKMSMRRLILKWFILLMNQRSMSYRLILIIKRFFCRKMRFLYRRYYTKWFISLSQKNRRLCILRIKRRTCWNIFGDNFLLRDHFLLEFYKKKILSKTN